MSEGKKPGLLHFLQRLFGLGGDKLKPARPAPPAKKNRASHAPKRKLPGKGSAHKKPSSDKEPASPDKPATKVAAKPKVWDQTEGPASRRTGRSTGGSSPARTAGRGPAAGESRGEGRAFR